MISKLFFISSPLQLYINRDTFNLLALFWSFGMHLGRRAQDSSQSPLIGLFYLFLILIQIP